MTNIINFMAYREQPYRDRLEAAKAELVEWREHAAERAYKLVCLAEELPEDSELRMRMEKVAGDLNGC